MARNRGYRGSPMEYDREFGARTNIRPYEVAYRNEQQGAGRWGGYQGQGTESGFDRGYGSRERMTFRPRHPQEYDRDMGDQLREGWHDLKRGVKRAFGGGYDVGYRGSAEPGPRMSGYGNREPNTWGARPSGRESPRSGYGGYRW